MTASAQSAPAAAPASAVSPPIALIELGTTSVRMTIAQVKGEEITTLDFLQQSVSFGKDTFTKGRIEPAHIEECVRALKSFRKKMQEFGVTQPSQIRAVAVAALGEASNHEAMLDRVYMGSGIPIQLLDPADMTRLTYISVQSFLKAVPALARSNVLIAEVGGGNTELLLLKQDTVVLSGTYGLGSLRMLEMVDGFRAPAASRRQILENQIQRTLERIGQGMAASGALNMISLGNEARFAANILKPEKSEDELSRISLKALSKLTDDVLALPADDIVKKYQLPYPEAETLGIALLVHLKLALTFGLRNIVVTNISTRQGLLLETAGAPAWRETFVEKITGSALEVGRRYANDEPHAHHVTLLAQTLFDTLQEEHQLGARERLLLTVAGLLHDAGTFISTRSHHKHSMYLIQNSDIFGLSRHDTLLVSVIARYHRRAAPRPEHVEFSSLSREDRIAVAKLAAILRVADSMDLSHSGRIRDIRCQIEEGQFVIVIPHVEDLSLEQTAMKQKGAMFRDVYGLEVALRGEHHGQ